MQVARLEQEGVGSPDEEALFASQEGVKRPTVLATEHSSRWNWIKKKCKRLAQNDRTLKQRMEATKGYPALTGSKTPTSKCGWSKEVRWEINCP
ncbi:hypothetical protein FT638_22760 [Bacillus cereus]|nr:hypothetical protein [Bacillus cereus]